jgi:hypothetical protein
MKYWVNTARKQLLAIDQDYIYVRKKFEPVFYGDNPTKEALGLEASLHIPFHYLDRVNFIEKRNEIKIYYSNGSSETVFVADDSDKKEIYSIFKMKFPKALFFSFTPTSNQVGRPQIIGAIVTLIVFIVCLALTRIEFTEGLHTSRYLGIIMLLKGISNFGIVKVTVAYFIVSGLILLRLRKRISEIEKIDVIQITTAKTDLDPNDDDIIQLLV